MPRRSLPSEEIVCGFHGGSHARSAFASEIAGIISSFRLASIAIDAPIPQPCAVSVTSPMGHTASYQYDSMGNVVQATDGNGNTTAWRRAQSRRLMDHTIKIRN